MTFGQKLYQLRRQKGVSQEQLAQALQTTRQAVSKWENDQGLPETENLMRLGNYFGVTVDSLLMPQEDELAPEAQGYFLTREGFDRFVHFGRGNAFLLGLAVFMLVAACILPVAMPENEGIANILFMATVAMGLAFAGWFVYRTALR